MLGQGAVQARRNLHLDFTWDLFPVTLLFLFSERVADVHAVSGRAYSGELYVVVHEVVV